MAERDLATAAHHALANIDDERELVRNPLLPGESASYGALRLVVLSALESLESVDESSAGRKRRLRHAILVRCDVRGESHRVVIDALAMSRRQFYRERREALLSLARAIQARTTNATILSAAPATVIDLGDAAEAYLEALRSAGQYRVVWEEASALARRAEGAPKAMEFWLLSAEAARFCGDAKSARTALAYAARFGEKSQWRSLWLASSAMSLHWIAGESADARGVLDRTVNAGSDERALHGKDATLLAITLVSAAFMEIDCGRWDRARSLLARASSLAKSGGGSKRQSLQRLASLIFRLSGVLALHADGDDARAVAAHRAALEAARASADLGTVAMTAIQLAVALNERDVRQSLVLADYGIEIAGKFYPGDRLAESTLELIPLLLRARGPEAALEALERAHRPGLGARDALFLEFGAAEIASHCGRFEEAAERAEAVCSEFHRHGIDAWACDARVAAAEAYVKLGQRRLARRTIHQFSETAVNARASTQIKARSLLPLVDLNVMLPA